MKRILILSASVVAMTAVFSAAQASTDVNNQTNVAGLQSQESQLSYSLGVETGRAFKVHDIKIDPRAFAQGLTDGSGHGKPKLTDAQMKQILESFQKRSIARLEKKLSHQSEQNSQKGAAFLAANKSKPGVKLLPNGLQYKILKKGKGVMPSKADVVTVNYEGRLINGKVFDSSFRRGKPATFPVGGVIKGWQEVLTHMHAGATWEVFIPAQLAYGKSGAPGIGPNQTLIFKIELISVQKK